MRKCEPGPCGGDGTFLCTDYCFTLRMCRITNNCNCSEMVNFIFFGDTGKMEAEFTEQWKRTDVFTAPTSTTTRPSAEDMHHVGDYHNIGAMDQESWDDHIIMKLYHDALETHSTQVS
jgi:hypothetical protein